jgi:hypothetical protein
MGLLEYIVMAARNMKETNIDAHHKNIRTLGVFNLGKYVSL